MKLPIRSSFSGAIAVFALSVTGHLAHAETVTTVNGAAIESDVLDFYIQSRTNRPAAQATAEEREALTSELTDIFLLSTQESATSLEKEPQIRAQLELQRRGILAQAVAADFYSSVTVSQEEIAAEYANQVKLAPAQQFKARHILVETQGQAVEIITLLNGGADFQELARERSTGPSGPNGGELGWFSPDQMVAAFSDAVAKLEDGGYTKEPVQTQFGWHVILREESRSAEAPTLESAQTEITQYLQNVKFQAYLQSLRDDAKN
ncbi:MAG: peptidylprolyl isomerase [Gammaproteobacteria bacterium]|nr:peptidylprolyl isomerase [Gammaproteobacteria bacterium]MDH4316019.1 peptidylprolyl isomerase [Gammaproteobacteria bacterium]MDH5215588.1 peptidylprolyl isomerase [Gammaproteobacteria bacterium]MDH5501932.1 peptidylprolyl isomerase [Gammaproteobacteria bacterium]